MLNKFKKIIPLFEQLYAGYPMGSLAAQDCWIPLNSGLSQMKALWKVFKKRNTWI
jgi:hypothetical protein